VGSDNRSRTEQRPAVNAGKELVANAPGIRMQFVLTLHADLVHAANAVRPLEVSENE
jgi:hypothetical protein